jgi:hypothetical protein
MQEIPRPALLDPDRLLLDDRNDLSAEEHANRAASLDKALHETCSYAQQLWQDLDALRSYLLENLPPGTGTAGDGQRRSAAPTGPDDEEGWERWAAAYAAVTSVLAGPHGDSGFGMDEARREARDRRVMLEQLATAEETAAQAEQAVPSQPGETGAGETDSRSERSAGKGRRRGRAAARAVVVLLAVRGLRRSRG